MYQAAVRGMGSWSGLKFRVTCLPGPSNIAENITQHLWSALSPGLHKTLANLFSFLSAELCTSLPSSFTLSKWPCVVHCRAKRKHQNTTPTLSLVSTVWQKEPNLSQIKGGIWESEKTYARKCYPSLVPQVEALPYNIFMEKIPRRKANAFGVKKPKEFLSFLQGTEQNLINQKKLCLFVCLKYLFIYLAALGLSCGMQESLVVAHGIQFPDQGSNLGPLHWALKVLATGPPGKSWKLCFSLDWTVWS